MSVFVMVYFGILGLILGSFYNVLAYRLPTGRFFSNQRSVCPNCHLRISYYDLVPIFSYLFLGGRCRSCKASIPILYPLVEGLTSIIFILAYLKWGLTWSLLYSLVLFSLLICLSVSDIYYMRIPNRYYLIFGPFILISWLMAMVERGLQRREVLEQSLLSLSLSILVFFVIGLFMKDKLGMGDIKLFLFLALFFPPMAFVWLLFLSSFLATTYLFVVERENIYIKIPFGPFIGVSGIIVSLLSLGF